MVDVVVAAGPAFADPNISDDDVFADGKGLFDDAPSPILRPPPKTLFASERWTVLEKLSSTGCRVRVLVQQGFVALDQTRVEIDDDGAFRRDRLFAFSHQVQTLALAAAWHRWSTADRERAHVTVLGGGGLAFPMALLAALPRQAHMTVVELDGEVIDCCRKFFGCTPEEDAGRLTLLEADAFAFVLEGGLPPACSAVVLDMDIMRWDGGYAAALSPDFWVAVWKALGCQGIICVNTIGGSAEQLSELAAAMLLHAPACMEMVAGSVEPSADCEEAWSSFRPRPSVLVLAPGHILRLFDEAGLHSFPALSSVAAGDTEDAAGAATTAALVRLAADVAQQLADGQGLAGAWHYL